MHAGIPPTPPPGPDPPGPDIPPGADTPTLRGDPAPPRSRPSPRTRHTNPPPPGSRLLHNTVNEQLVCILLECILVVSMLVKGQSSSWIRSVYYSPLQDSHSHPIHTCFLMIASNEFDWLTCRFYKQVLYFDSLFHYIVTLVALRTPLSEYRLHYCISELWVVGRYVIYLIIPI